MPTKTDEITLAHSDEQLTLSREERKVLTYLVSVMDGEAARQSDVVAFANISKSDATRLRKRMKEKGMVDDMTLVGENDGTPLNDPVAWEATDKAHELAGSVALETDEMTLAERMTLLEQSLGDIAERTDDEGVSEELEALQDEVERIWSEVKRHQTTVNNLRMVIRAILRSSDDLPDQPDELVSDFDDLALR